MGKIGVGEWTVERERERYYKISSPTGEVLGNRIECQGQSQTWIVDADIDGNEPMSWRVKVSEKTEIVSQVIPAILTEQTPANTTSRSN